MKLLDFIRLVQKHLVLLIISPFIMALLVVFLTADPDFRFASETTLYTGIATGSSVEMDKSFNYFITNTAFDNLINIIKSRKTQQEVAIRLLSLHLMLDQPEEQFISKEAYDELKQLTPAYIYSYVEKDNEGSYPMESQNDSDLIELPDYISRGAYEQTVKNLTNLMLSNDTNFVYDLLNYPTPYYSYKEISEIKVQRIGNSDLVQIKYETGDPGICKQTLAILTNVCIRNYRDIKENRSDAVVRYFEEQLEQASVKLRQAEDKLLTFNKENKIINYYEQSKAVAVVKEDLDVEYNRQKMRLAGYEAAIKRLEEKLGFQEQVQQKSTKIMELKEQLTDINYKIASSEIPGSENYQKIINTEELRQDAEALKKQIRDAVGELYSYKNSIDGLPTSTVLNEWMANVIEAENVKAGLDVLENRIKEFQQQYEIYAPAGANIKRIEREISVSEQEFLEILHGLNLAKLKMQDNELSASLKVVDKPFFPISPIPTKRKILVLLAAFLGFMIVLSLVIVTEYFDQSLRNLSHAGKVLDMEALGLMPKILLKTPKIPISKITKRLVEVICQNLELTAQNHQTEKKLKTVLFFSTQPLEGKTVLAGNLAHYLRSLGKEVVFLNYSKDSLAQNTAISGAESEKVFSEDNSIIYKNKISIINKLLGYPDSRIDFKNPFLQNPKEYLKETEYLEYSFDGKLENLDAVLNYVDANHRPNKIDYLFIEIPSILNYAYPVDLISAIDFPVLVCRANRGWTDADQAALNVLLNLNGNDCSFILNGVELKEVETVLGELPRKRSWLRRAVKRLVMLQFLSKNHL